jgi:hypothetical protein
MICRWISKLFWSEGASEIVQNCKGVPHSYLQRFYCFWIGQSENKRGKNYSGNKKSSK